MSSLLAETTTVPPEVSAEIAGLHYVTDTIPGISRKAHKDDFQYFDPKGKLIEDPAVVQRIRSLAIPPAYQRVWISPDRNGHLQATGYDARGRKQYRYHPRFREVRDEAKYGRMIAFGEALPKIREKIDADLARPGLDREKVLAAVVYLLEKSLIRVGNEEYAKENKSFGLTTMKTRHVRVEGSKIEFNFLGKSKVKHRIALSDRRLARVVKKIQDLPGQELFQYLDDDGNRHSITSSDVNSYLDAMTDEHFTAKDFRTWAGTVLALTELAALEPAETKVAAKRGVTTVLKVVAHQLGNTPAVCRKCYVHPFVLEAYTSGKLRDLLADKVGGSTEAASDLIECAEDVVLDLLKKHESGASPAQAKGKGTKSADAIKNKPRKSNRVAR